jgi:hypothetical protein
MHCAIVFPSVMRDWQNILSNASKIIHTFKSQIHIRGLSPDKPLSTAIERSRQPTNFRTVKKQSIGVLPDKRQIATTLNGISQ